MAEALDVKRTAGPAPPGRWRAWLVLAQWYALLAAVGSLPAVAFSTPGGWAWAGKLALKGLVFAALAYLAGALDDALRLLVATAVGLRVERVTFGHGPELAHLKVGRLAVSFHAMIYGIVTWKLPLPFRRPRIRLWLVVAAGPLAHTLCLAFLFWPGGVTPHRAYLALFSDPRVAPLASFFIVNAVGLVYTLVPVVLPSRRRSRATSGYRLLHLLAVPSKNLTETIVNEHLKAVTELLSAGRVADARTACEAILAHYPDSLAAGFAEAGLLLEEHRFEDAREAFMRLARASEDARSRAALEIDAAWADLFIDGETAVAEAAELSAAAVRLLPNDGWAKTTRGAALVRSGDPAAGLSWLEDALPLARGPRSEAQTHAWLAAAHAALGRRDEAQRHLDEARALHSESYSLPQAEEAVAAFDAGASSAGNDAADG